MLTPDTRQPSAASSQTDRFARLAALGLAALLAVVWLVGESHGIYGDEAAHIEILRAAFAAPAHGVLDRLWKLYLFDSRYPPLFYICASPFVLLAADPVFGARFFVALLALATAAVGYRVFRILAPPSVAFSGIVLLYSNGIFVEASRYFLLEASLGLCLLMLIGLVASYQRSRRAAHLLGIGVLLAVGSLTKFNFLMYAGPLLVPILYYELRRPRTTNEITFTRGLLLVFCPLLLLAGPWYAIQLAGPNSALRGLRQLNESGSLANALSLPDVFSVTARVYTAWLSPVLLLLSGLAVLACVITTARRTGLLFLNGNRDHLQTPTVRGLLLSLLVIPVVLALTGLGNTARWHFEFIYLVTLIVFVVSQSMIPAARRVALVVVFAAGGLQILAWVTTYPAPSFLLAPRSALLPKPSRVDIGARSIASEIVNYERHLTSTDDRSLVLFLTHEHRGMHSSAVQFYLDQAGVRLQARVPMFFDRPIDLRNYFDARYVVTAAGDPVPGQRVPDPELWRNLALWAELPDSYRNRLETVAQVNGRYGVYQIFFVTPTVQQEALVNDVVAIAKSVDPRPYNQVQLDARALLMKVKSSERGSPDAISTAAQSVVERSANLQEHLSALNSRELSQLVLEVRGVASLKGKRESR